MSRRIDDLTPDFQPTARLILARLEGLPIMVFMTLRTAREQFAFYAQGRDPSALLPPARKLGAVVLSIVESAMVGKIDRLEMVNRIRLWADLPPIREADNTYTITNCDGVINPSPHQSGDALDIVAKDSRGNPSWDYAKYASVYRAIRSAALECGAEAGGSWMTLSSGKPSPYAKWDLGWDPPHVQKRS